MHHVFTVVRSNVNSLRMHSNRHQDHNLGSFDRVSGRKVLREMRQALIGPRRPDRFVCAVGDRERGTPAER